MMEPFKMDGDNNRLYFKNYENRSDDEEFEEIVDILIKEGVVIGEKYIAPDCDWYQNCLVCGKEFDIIYTIDGDGTFLYAEDTETIEKLKKLFMDNHNRKMKGKKDNVV